jgi:hypothetical protein
MSFETYFGNRATEMIFEDLATELMLNGTVDIKKELSKPITTLADNIKFICANWSVLSKATTWDFYQPALEDSKGK